jgi:dipeptidyl aminopeptidase/acylaminoacyl peptidase
MTDDRTLHLSDGLIRAAITQDPPDGTVVSLWRDVVLAVGETPQRHRRLVAWPWTPALPGVPTSGRRHLRRVAIGALVALLVASSVAIVGLIGSTRRLPPPFGFAKPGLIAFDSGGDIVVSNVDGSGWRQLTSGPGWDVQPTWSPDGTRIAYQSLLTEQRIVELIVMEADGSNRTMIGTKPATVDVSGAVSLDWSRVAWSPDSRSVAYTGLVDGRPEIFVARADGTSLMMIGDPILESQDPAWSPDGGRIAFRGGRFDADRGIYLMNSDGSDVRRLTTTDPNPQSVTDSYFAYFWSPDGRSIAYTTWEPLYAQQIWVVNVDDGVARSISDTSSYNEFPAWSPDGTRIAYYTSRMWNADGGRFVVVSLDGAYESVLPPTVYGPPEWSPDGTKLVGVAPNPVAGGRVALTVIDIDQGTSLAVPPGGSMDAGGLDVHGTPSWQRLAD